MDSATTLCCTTCGTPLLEASSLDGLPTGDRPIPGQPEAVRVRLAAHVYEVRCIGCVREAA